ncbi:50S ribosomal protein L24 [Candidatus Symbiobacter mobilis]|uniref:Large ribosomal subunit protein uL24 n=1 Tax=Candidatus Symbiobacter mobilis CR TaxID=946483 RepID=U5N515_9BURK|nr:50S ribosomal protein L24 [Candidatus Symbiobacter mobilis]AGX86335.1 ribosomal protein L24 [Candidatus Symbiobacter mobilis CR]
MNKIRTGDEVIVLTGIDKGKIGRVLARVDDSYLVVDGVSQVLRHERPDPHREKEGGIHSKTMPIHQSNVAIFNAGTGKADKVKIRILESGQRVRAYKSTGEEIARSEQ